MDTEGYTVSVMGWIIGKTVVHERNLLENWNGGIMGIKMENNIFFLTPSFQYSIIPIFWLE